MYNGQHILGTFDFKPTTTPVATKPDELMIDWTTLPVGSKASIYLPSVSARDIIETAVRIYGGSQPFTQTANHTVHCNAQGITYLPVPRAPGNIAGLIIVKLPATVKVGSKLSVGVKQLTKKSAEIRVPVNETAELGSFAALSVRPRDRTKGISWRKVAGTFQLAVKIKDASKALQALEQKYSVLKWVFEAIPTDSRWYPIFEKYLGLLADDITAWGGNPAKIKASGAGTGHGVGQGGHTGGGHEHGSGTGTGNNFDTHFHLMGKIEGLIYDHFGDFEGFILEIEDGEKFHFFSRERHLEEVANRAWAERLRITVFPEEEHRDHPRRIVLHPVP